MRQAQHHTSLIAYNYACSLEDSCCIMIACSEHGVKCEIYRALAILPPHGQKLDVELDSYNISHDIKIYPGTKHSFFNDKGSRYDAAASEDAWGRITKFFGEHIGASPVP